MRIVAAGVSGFIGGRLLPALRDDGHDVVQLVRKGPTHAGQRLWNPHVRRLDPDVLDGVDAVINMCGANIGDHRWTAKYKQQLRASRINPTSFLAEECATRGIPTLLNASGIHYYGPRFDAEILTERSKPGTSFLALLCVDWEAATLRAAEAGTSVVTLRTSPVVGREADLVMQLGTVTQLMMGGRLGSGNQYFPWISPDDYVRAIQFLLAHPEVSGPVNLTAPYAVTNAEFIRELGRALNRPTPWVIPAPVLRIVLGQFAIELLGGQRAVPAKLHDAGFEFRYRTLPEALAHEFDQGPPALLPPWRLIPTP
jgi:uncharacterized protein